MRLDLLSAYEQEAEFIEIVALMGSELPKDFEVKQVIMKAPPDEPARVSAMIANQFRPHTQKKFPYEHYYMKVITEIKE